MGTLFFLPEEAYEIDQRTRTVSELEGQRTVSIMNVDAAMKVDAATEPPVTVHAVLRQLLDDLTEVSAPQDRSAAYRVGFNAGIRFARICVLDEIAAASGYVDRVAMSNGIRRNRERVLIRAAVRTIERRLAAEVTARNGDDGAAGYRDAIAVARETVSGLQHAAH